MPITCQICKRDFANIITSTHLKVHEYTSKMYKDQFGEKSLASDEYREVQKAGASGVNNGMYGKNHTEESKQRSIATKAKTRASRPPKTPKVKAPRVKKERDNKAAYAKACATRERNGTKLFSFQGYKHSTKAKELMAQASARSNVKKIETSMTTRMGFVDTLSSFNISLLNNIDASVLEFLCLKCNSEFTRTEQILTLGKFHTKLCQVCNPPQKQLAQNSILERIKAILPNLNILANKRGIIGRKELDIFVPEVNVAIEYCGLFWHSDYFNKELIDKRHLEKLNDCIEKGIKLITVFEDEYLNRPELVISKLALSLGNKPKTKLHARKCTVKAIDSKTASLFLNENHLQGNGKSNARYGLFHGDELVSVMTFSNSNISRKLKGWEINRYCSESNTIIVGGASKLFNRFLIEHDPQSVVSYSDRRWGTGAVYGALGFTFSHHSPPNYWYIVGGKRIHRFALRKNKSDDQTLTEWENRQKQGYSRIWDCGHTKWVWNKP